MFAVFLATPAVFQVGIVFLIAAIIMVARYGINNFVRSASNLPRPRRLRRRPINRSRFGECRSAYVYILVSAACMVASYWMF